MKPLAEKRILVVDDEELIRDILREELSSLGAHVDEASGGVIALEMIQNNKYDAVLTDVRMPAGDGRFLVEGIYACSEPRPKIFICTGFDKKDLEWIDTYSVVDVFTKPFDFATLAAAMIAELNAKL